MLICIQYTLLSRAERLAATNRRTAMNPFRALKRLLVLVLTRTTGTWIGSPPLKRK
jgi:hypothetical protein